jgi:hypothetical protein
VRWIAEQHLLFSRSASTNRIESIIESSNSHQVQQNESESLGCSPAQLPPGPDKRETTFVPALLVFGQDIFFVLEPKRVLKR